MNAYKAIIAEYRQRRRSSPDQWVEDCRKERDILKVIEMAALARNKENYKHPHQHRLQNKTLRKFADRLLRNAERILKAKSFDSLYGMVNDLKVAGIGPLAVYDTAHRIGVRRRLLPDKVYMHQGTREGAEKYLGRKVPEQYLDKSVFKDFKSLRCDEIEDILCIYKLNMKSNGKCLPPSRFKIGGICYL